MFAPLLAILICLWVADPRIGSAEPASSPDREVVVYLKADPGQRIQPVQEMRREADALMAAAGYAISWRDLAESPRGTSDAFLAVIELRGACHAPEPAAPVEALMEESSLASTAVVGWEGSSL